MIAVCPRDSYADSHDDKDEETLSDQISNLKMQMATSLKKLEATATVQFEYFRSITKSSSSRRETSREATSSKVLSKRQKQLKFVPESKFNGYAQP